MKYSNKYHGYDATLMILHLCCQSTVGKDGAVMGVTVTRMSMNLHTQVLSQACSYTEGIITKLLIIAI